MGARVMVVGGLNTDFTVWAPQLPGGGDSVTGTAFLQGAGGKGLNAACCAARLGASVGLIGCVGADGRGRALVKHLLAEGVHIDDVLEVPGVATGAAVIVAGPGGTKQTAAALGANGRLTAEWVRSAQGRIARADVLVISLEVPLEAVIEAVAIAREAEVFVILDPAPAQPVPESLLRYVDVLRPNAAEAKALTGIDVFDAASARSAARALRGRGVGAAFVAASNGSAVVSAELDLWLPNLQVEAVDSTGAGDAGTGALAVALAEGHSLRDAALFAHAATAHAVTRLGAADGLPHRQAVLARLRLQAEGSRPESEMEQPLL